MAKKKNYSPREDPDWDEEEAKEHRRVIREKEKEIRNKYKKYWDTDTKNWRKGFNHGNATD